LNAAFVLVQIMKANAHEILDYDCEDDYDYEDTVNRVCLV